jgi:predicted RNA-binding Zn ribbon-like protein
VTRATSVLSIPAPRDELCLDFANTLSWRGSEQPTESLRNIDDLLDWLGARAGMPPALIDQARERAASELFATAIELREALYETFSEVAAGRSAEDGDLDMLNQLLAAAPPRTRLMPIETGYRWAIEVREASLPTLLAPVLWSAADLLTRPGLHRVRRCANDHCLWLFLDQSKAGTRRWCDMSSCGNRAKSRRHYLKTKAG